MSFCSVLEQIQNFQISITRWNCVKVSVSRLERLIFLLSISLCKWQKWTVNYRNLFTEINASPGNISALMKQLNSVGKKKRRKKKTPQKQTFCRVLITSSLFSDLTDNDFWEVSELSELIQVVCFPFFLYRISLSWRYFLKYTESSSLLTQMCI